jgi:hypothetical protein
MGSDRTQFTTVQEFVRAGLYRPLPHFRARAQERGFTVEDAVQLLAREDAVAWRHKSTWLVTEPAEAQPEHQLHVRVTLTTARVLLLTGWRADQRKTLRRFEREKEVAA